MTVPNTTDFNRYTATGSDADYQYTFRIFADSDLLVQEMATDGTITTLALTTDYTVDGVGTYGGGTVTLVAGNLTAGIIIQITRAPAITQQISLQVQGAYSPTAVEGALDLLTMIAQDAQTQLDRSIHGPLIDDSTVSMELPAAAERALLTCAFDSDGNVIAADSISGGTTVSSALIPFVTAASLKLARAILGVNGAPVINVLDSPYNATGNGSTDDTAAIQAAIDACPANGTVILPVGAAGNYKTTATITVSTNISVIMLDGVQNTYSGTAQSLRISSSNQRVVYAWYTDRSAVSWAANRVGIEINDLIDSDIFFSAKNYEKGLYINNTSGQVGECRFYPRQLFENKYGIYLYSNGGSVNANLFVGGRWSVADTTQPGTDRWGIYFRDAGTSKFLSPTLEIFPGNLSTDTAFVVACHGESKWNVLVDPYIEQGTYALALYDTARFNRIVGHVAGPTATNVYAQIYEDAAMSYPGTNTIDWTTNTNVSLSKLVTQSVFPYSSFLRRVLANSNSGAGVSRYEISGFTQLGTGGTYNIQVAESTTRYLTKTEFVIDTTAVGRWVDTTFTKRFWLSVEKATTDVLNVVVVCYDAAGAILSGGTHVQGGSLNIDSIQAFAANANYGGSYVCGTVQDVTFFNVASTVKSIWVGVFAGGTTVGITGLSLKCEGNQSAPATNAGYDLVSNGAYSVADTMDLVTLNLPVGGVLNTGTRLYDLDTASGAAPGWNVTNRVSTTCNGGAAAAATTIPCTSITGMSSADTVGLIITKSGVSKWFWTTINGAPSAGNIVITDAIPATWAVSNLATIITYRFKAMAAIA